MISGDDQLKEKYNQVKNSTWPGWSRWLFRTEEASLTDLRVEAGREKNPDMFENSDRS